MLGPAWDKPQKSDKAIIGGPVKTQSGVLLPDIGTSYPSYLSMRHMSNAHFHQAEVTQVNRWDHGPLELVFLAEPIDGRPEWDAHIHEWNSTQRAGFLRSGKAMEGLKASIPGLEERRNPNMILVPTYAETSELDVMLAGLLPDSRRISALKAKLAHLLQLSYK
ncbi:hypothetical protein V1318_14125 [Lysobacter sp. CCNWLW3]|uniref:hypothetical protein n=1 Tax=unclassified Lysobacter TaxID=2635362 RepID=UPI002FD3F1CF